MKALVLNRPGSPENLSISDRPMPDPPAGAIRVKVMAVGLNPVDYKTADSGVPDWTYPHILGLDVAGVVDAVGDGVAAWQKGQRVFYHGDLSKPGGYAEYAIAPAHICAAIPETVSFEQAAAIPCAGYTAWQILTRKIPLKKGRVILVHGGAGGVGGFAVQMSRHLGLKVLTTCSKDKFAWVQELGADIPIDYRKEDVTQRVFDITGGRGADIIINTIDEHSATQDLGRFAFGGHLACVAGLPDFTVIEPFTKAISIHESALGGAHLAGDLDAQADLALMGKELMDLVLAGEMSPMLKEVISLEEVPQALTRLMQRHVTGKIVARP